jgi:rod shape-determining protein MreD
VNTQRAHALWVVHLTLALALIVHLMPLPLEWRLYRPPVVEVTLLYWVLALPHRIGVISAAALGAAMDIVDGGPLGAQSLGLVLAVIMVLINYQRIRQFDVLQQTGTIVLLVALVLVVRRWAHTVAGLPATGAEFLLPIVAVPVLWPLLRAVLRDLRRQWGVS